MVLKIKTINGWKFIDGIVEINVEETSPDKYNTDYGGHGRLYDDMFLYYHKCDKALTVIDNNNVNNMGVKEIHFAHKSGANKTFIADTFVYLLSDEGKTIERIN